MSTTDSFDRESLTSSIELPEIENTTQQESFNAMMVPHVNPSNPFAFSCQQMCQIISQKNIDFIEKMGGIEGIGKGLHSHLQYGLVWNEEHLEYIRMYDLMYPSKEKQEFYDGQFPISMDCDTFIQRRQIFGSNVLPEIKQVTLLNLMWQAFQDKTLILLTIAAVISLSVGIYEDIHNVERDIYGRRIPGVKWVEGVAIIAAVVLVVIVGSVNDFQKEKQFRSLNAKKDNRCVMAIRSGKQILVSVYDIQVGDVLKLEPGDIICADGIFIEGHNLKCDESASTGESDAVRKLTWQECLAKRKRTSLTTLTDDLVCISESDFIHHSKDIDDDFTPSSFEHRDVDPFLISGSKVLEGICTYLVTAVGSHSFHGRTLMALRTKDNTTPLQERLDTLAANIAKLGFVAATFLLSMLLIRCFIGYATGALSTNPAQVVSHVMQILITTITVVVVAVPEGLPLAVTLALAYATQRMLKDNNLVRVLAACETMGNATTICSDKTGTLTENKMSVVAGTLGSSIRFLKNPPASRTDLVDIHVLKSKIPIAVKNFLNQAMAINSTAFQNTDALGNVTLVGNKTETAMLGFAKEHLGSAPFEVLRSHWKVEHVFPFNSSRKAMATLICIPTVSGKTFYRLHVKGASELLLGKSSRIVSMHDPCYDQHQFSTDNFDIATRAMTEANRERMSKIIQSYSTRCLRTLAICYQDFDTWPDTRTLEQVLDAAQLTLLGIVGIEDPLRPGVREAVAACQKAGVYVRMVTGDNMLTAKSIARQCGIYMYGGIAMDGPTFRQLKHQERLALLPQLQVLARTSPEDKRLLVQCLREMGETVAVTGDGTNDAPALKEADVGFSMGIAGTEVAKEASSIILMDDNFSSIVKAISWGRCVNDSVKKFLQFQLTINITAVLSTIFSAIISSDQASILTAVQLLWVNLIMDTFAALALATDPPSPDLLNRLPEPRTAPLIDKCMWKMIIGQTIYQLIVILVLLYTNVLGISQDTTRLKTIIFNSFVFCQLFNEINCRRIDNHCNIFKGITKNHFFLMILAVSMCGQIFIVQYGGAAFQTVPLNRHHWKVCIFIGLMSIPIGAIIRFIPDSPSVFTTVKEVKEQEKVPVCTSLKEPTTKKDYDPSQQSNNVTESIHWSIKIL